MTNHICTHPDQDKIWGKIKVCSSCYIHLLRVEHYPKNTDKEEIEMLKKKGVKVSNKEGKKGGRSRDGSKQALIEDLLKKGKEIGDIVEALQKLNPDLKNPRGRIYKMAHKLGIEIKSSRKPKEDKKAKSSKTKKATKTKKVEEAPVATPETAPVE